MTTTFLQREKNNPASDIFGPAFSAGKHYCRNIPNLSSISQTYTSKNEQGEENFSLLT